MSFLLRLAINAVAIWLATVLLSGLTVVAGDGASSTVLVLLVVALVFGLVNAVVKPIVKIIAFPLYVLTLGLFTFVVNALMLMLTGWLSELTSYGLRVESFGTAVIGAILISVISFLLSVIVPGAREKE